MRASSCVVVVFGVVFASAVLGCGESEESEPGGAAAAGGGAGQAGRGGAGAAAGTGASAGTGAAGTGATGGTEATGGTGATAGSGGIDAGSGASDTGDASDGDAGGESDFNRLAACPGSQPCRESLAQLIEAYGRNVDVVGLQCVLEGLRDRTPGKYLHNTDSTFGNGSVGAHHLLIVASDGSVAYARDSYYYPFSNHPAESSQRCTLKPASYFDGCLQALASPQSDPAWACAFGDGTATTPSTLPWFESCAIESPPVCQ